jgi:hypothetical protein
LSISAQNRQSGCAKGKRDAAGGEKRAQSANPDPRGKSRTSHRQRVAHRRIPTPSLRSPPRWCVSLRAVCPLAVRPSLFEARRRRKKGQISANLSLSGRSNGQHRGEGGPGDGHDGKRRAGAVKRARNRRLVIRTTVHSPASPSLLSAAALGCLLGPEPTGSPPA